MLVQGFIDLVGHALCGNDNDKITLFGGARTSVGYIEVGTPTYGWTGGIVSNEKSQVRVISNMKYIWLGTSDISVMSTDCTLENAKGATLGTVKGSNNKVVVTGTYTNDTSETKIFKEIGLTTEGLHVNSSLSILLSRSVFPEPVVIPAGESKSFTITIDFNKFADTVVTA